MLRKVLTLIAMMLSFAVSAKDYTFKEGLNTIDSYVPANGTFTSDRDGKVLIECQDVWEVKYDGKTEEHKYVPGSSYAFVYEVAGVKAGTTIAINNSFPMNNKLRITVYADGAIPVEVLNVAPRTGKVFDWNNTGMVSVNFNKVITLSSIKLVAGSYTADVDDVHVGSSLGFNISNALNAALKDGKVITGEKFQIVIKGLRDAADRENLYNGNGELVIEYVAPYAQNEFVGASVGETKLSYLQANTYKFLSYYSPDEEDGVFVFEFDAEVGKLSNVYLTMGNLDLDAQGKYYRGTLPYTIDGKKVIVDARGVLRTIAVLFPAIIEEEIEEGEVASDLLGSFDTEHLTITLSNVLDKNGNAFLCKTQGSVGNYSFVMGYEEIIDEAYIDGDNKQDGDEVRAGEDISLWVSNAGIKFDALEVTYIVEVPTQDENDQAVKEARTMLVKEYVAEPDALEGVIVTFVMPDLEGVVEGSTVRVALHDAKSADGMPHYLYIEFKAASSNTTDGISQIKMQNSSKTYHLDGTEAVAGKAGIFVRDGKKVVLK